MVLQVVTSTFVRTVTVGGRQLSLMIAKETGDWKRTYLAPVTREQLRLGYGQGRRPCQRSDGHNGVSAHSYLVP